MRDVVYVTHKLSAPTREEMLANGRTAALWCSWLCRHFMVATVADWIVMSSVLEETADHRALGLACDFELISRCDVLIHTGTRISGGMKLEEDHARARGKRVVDLTTLGQDLPPEDFWFLRDVKGILATYGIRRYLPEAS